MVETAEALEADLKVGHTQRHSKTPVELKPEQYFKSYGKEIPGYLTFNEFQQIYMTHVYFASEVLQKKPVPEKAKLKALFDSIDTQNRGRINPEEFAAFIKNKQVSGGFLEKLSNKVLKGKERFVAALNSELTTADKAFGSHGIIPLPAFQTIMADYGLPMLEHDT
jgi:IQ calmodulin-binding motif